MRKHDRTIGRMMAAMQSITTPNEGPPRPRGDAMTTEELEALKPGDQVVSASGVTYTVMRVHLPGTFGDRIVEQFYVDVSPARGPMRLILARNARRWKRHG